MHKLLKMSWLNVKNGAYSKEFLLGIMAALAYSMLWIFFVHPPHYGLGDYDFEIGRFLYVIILYEGVSILRNDIRFNIAKTVFAGVFSRVEIMVSKLISLIIWGIIFSLVVEINNVLAACILHKKIGITGFLAINHLQLFITYIVITLCMGSLMLLIVSIIFSDRKNILFCIMIFSMVNFFTAGITVLIGNHPELTHKFFVYMKTPFYNTTMLMQGNFNMQAVLINIAWAAIFYMSSVFIINKREIK